MERGIGDHETCFAAVAARYLDDGVRHGLDQDAVATDRSVHPRRSGFQARASRPLGRPARDLDADGHREKRQSVDQRGAGRARKGGVKLT